MWSALTSGSNFVLESLETFVESTGVAGLFANMGWGSLVMICVAFFLLYLAIKHKFEPLLLLTIAFGMLLTNLPGANLYHTELFAGGHVHWDIFVAKAGLLDYLYLGVKLGIYPCLIFLGVGAMTDFGPLIANPKSFLLGAAAQIGIFVTFLGAYAIGFSPEQSGSIGIIGGADGPTAIYLTSMLAPELLGPIAVAAYSYMALVPVIQPPIMRLLTNKHERAIRMRTLRPVSKTERILFPIIISVVIALLLAVVHGIVPSVRNMAEKQWPAIPMLGNVNGKTIAVLGTGDIGNNAARICAAMGARVLGFKLHACEPFPPYSEIYTGDDGLDALLPQADAVLVCLPGSPFTKDMLDARRIGLMKAGSVLVNIGRGSIVNTEALMEALNAGRIAGAALDVVVPEPLPREHPLWSTRNLLLTPHISGNMSLGYTCDINVDMFCRDLENYAAGRPLEHRVDRKRGY